MSILEKLPENSGRRLLKVMVRTLHLIGIAGMFGQAMNGGFDAVYTVLAVVSGLVLVLMEAYSGLIWFVQLRGIAVCLKLLFLVFIHLAPESAIPCLITMIVISGFMSHAPNWIRYYSLRHKRVIRSKEDLLG